MRAAAHNYCLLIAAALFLLCRGSASGDTAYRLAGHVPSAKQLSKARHIGRHRSSDRVKLSIALKPRDSAGLQDLLSRLYDPKDSEYGHFLTPSQFKERYAPSADDVAQVAQFMNSHGLKVSQVHENNLLLDVEGAATSVEETFQVELHDYTTEDGSRAFAPNRDPLVNQFISGHVNAVTGLNNFSRFRTHRLKSMKRIEPNAATAHASVSDYMTPSKLKNAYGLSTLATSGSGETVALFQLDGYAASDVAAFASYFSISAPPLQNVLVDGVSGAAGADAVEVCLDIELVMAAAPGVSKIMVYEGPNTESGVLHTYGRIANDNIAKAVSSSWGAPEDTASASFRNAENVIFQQMAAQGQSIFVASGDAGAFDDSARPGIREVDDPASQPFVTAVGGTTITLDGSNNYLSETSWGSGTAGGGGGLSTVWGQPSWQNGLGTALNQGTSSQRMVPDVSLDANPSSGYPIYVNGSWYAVGGTSAAAPLWAAFAAIVNQTRVAGGQARMGFANPAIYQIGQSSLYSSSFHDIADNSTNLYFPAVTGYDLSTGWGTLKGPGLISALSNGTLPPSPPTGVNTISGAGSITVFWTASANTTSYNVLRSNTLNGTYTAVAVATTSTTFTDSVSGTYFYYVVSNNSAGSSLASEKKSATGGVSPPGAPTGLNAVVVP